VQKHTLEHKGKVKQVIQGRRRYCNMKPPYQNKFKSKTTNFMLYDKNLLALIPRKNIAQHGSDNFNYEYLVSGNCYIQNAKLSMRSDSTSSVFALHHKSNFEIIMDLIETYPFVPKRM
jgi:hypothetical protein